MLDTLASILAGIGYVADTPGSLARGLLAGRPGERLGGRDMLESWGMLGSNRDGLDAGDVIGFGADLLFDPLNFVGGGLLTKLLAGNKAIAKSNAASKALRAKGAMPEEIAKLTKIKGVPEYEELAAKYPGGENRIEQLFRVKPSDEPMKMYHGTGHEFGQYDMGRMDPDGLYGPGIYTTSDPHIGSDYALNASRRASYRRPTEQDLLEYFKPGRKVKSWSGATDEVISVHTYPKTGLFHSVTVRGEDGSVRNHATIPDMNHVDEALGRSPAPNVRMQYIDARKPFDADGHINDAAESIRRRMGEIMDGYVNSNVSATTQETLRGAAHEAYRDVGPSMVGKHVYNWFNSYSDLGATEELKKLGYDAIAHTGGVQGGKKHHVVIAFDPSQIYAPYIAPALRDQRRVQPLVGALIGYNAAAHNPMHDL